MSNFNLSVDLLKLQGAKVHGLNIDGRMRNCLVIPVAWNDIEVKVDSNNVPQAAPLYLRGWETSDAYVNACKANHEDESDYVAPSHTLSVNYREEFTEKAIEAAYNRLKADPTKAGMPEDELRKLAKYEVREKQRIGSMKVLAKKPQPTLQGTATPIQGAPGAFQQEVDNVSDDLPF